MTWPIQWQQRRRHDWNDVSVCAMCACVWLPPPIMPTAARLLLATSGEPPHRPHHTSTVRPPTAWRASKTRLRLYYNTSLITKLSVGAGREHGRRARPPPPPSSPTAILASLQPSYSVYATNLQQPYNPLYISRGRAGVRPRGLYVKVYTRVMRSVVYLVWVFRCRGRSRRQVRTYRARDAVIARFAHALASTPRARSLSLSLYGYVR